MESITIFFYFHYLLFFDCNSVIFCLSNKIQFLACSISLSEIIVCCCIRLGEPYFVEINLVDSLYFLGIILGDVIKNLLLISGHIGQLDSSLALQKIQEGHPLTITSFVWWPSLSVWLTNGNSISGESCDSIGLRISHTSFCGGSKKTKILPLKSINVLASSKSSCISSSILIFLPCFPSCHL